MKLQLNTKDKTIILLSNWEIDTLQQILEIILPYKTYKHFQLLPYLGNKRNDEKFYKVSLESTNKVFPWIRWETQEWVSDIEIIEGVFNIETI